MFRSSIDSGIIYADNIGAIMEKNAFGKRLV